MNGIRKVLSYSDVWLIPQYSPYETKAVGDLRYTYTNIPLPFYSIPLINSPMDTLGIKLGAAISELGLSVSIHRFFETVEDQIEAIKEYREITKNEKEGKNLFVAVGSFAKHKEWIKKLLKYKQDTGYKFGFLLDMAHGNTQAAIDTVAYLYQYMNDSGLKYNIMAGNVATKDGFERLTNAGANFIRVGIGSGSICSTRLKTGYGITVLSSIVDCAKVKRPGTYIVADGGIEHSGDICKALAAGADMVMCGKLFAGTSKADGLLLDKDLEITDILDRAKWIQYWGMASSRVQKNVPSKGLKSIEGAEGIIPYTGKTEEIVKGILGNLQNAMVYYGGCKNWYDFQRTAEFQEFTFSGIEESRVRIKEQY